MAKVSLGKAARQSAAKAGLALPNGKYPIRSKKELQAAIKLRHKSTEPYGKVQAHIKKRAAGLGVKLTPAMVASGRYEEFAVGPGKRHGRSNSLKWPWLYDKLRAKGYDKAKAAAISNAKRHTRKGGRVSVLPAKMANNPAVLAKLRAADAKGKHSTKGSLRK